MLDVARRAGVSKQTVSRVLRDEPVVSPRLRSLVLAAVEDLGYRPNLNARTLSTGRSHIIGILALPTTSVGPTTVMFAVERTASELGYGCVVVSLDETSRSAATRAVERLIAAGVDGVVNITPFALGPDQLPASHRDLPVVTIEGSSSTSEPTAGVDQQLGAALATRHLLDLGHRTVWHVRGPNDWPEAHERELGWRTTLAAAGAVAPPVLVGDWTAESGFNLGETIAHIPDATAVFVANDQMALGLLLALRERGHRVPEDVSVVGFDNVPESAYYSPPLTTIHQHLDLLGQHAVDLLMPRINGETSPRVRDLIAPDLVVRRSTAPVGNAQQ